MEDQIGVLDKNLRKRKRGNAFGKNYAAENIGKPNKFRQISSFDDEEGESSLKEYQTKMGYRMEPVVEEEDGEDDMKTYQSTRKLA